MHLRKLITWYDPHYLVLCSFSFFFFCYFVMMTRFVNFGLCKPKNIYKILLLFWEFCFFIILFVINENKDIVIIMWKYNSTSNQLTQLKPINSTHLPTLPLHTFFFFFFEGVPLHTWVTKKENRIQIVMDLRW